MGDIVAGSGPEYKYVVCNAEIRCLFGEETFVFESGGVANAQLFESPQLTVNDTNITTFKNCYSPFNPDVVEATMTLKPDGEEIILRAQQDAMSKIAGMEDAALTGNLLDYDTIDGVKELEKVPCVPCIEGCWLNGYPVKNIGGAEALLHISSIMCTYCGQIIILNDGQ